jgi:cupin 2 domain-containing protein
LRGTDNLILHVDDEQRGAAFSDQSVAGEGPCWHDPGYAASRPCTVFRRAMVKTGNLLRDLTAATLAEETFTTVLDQPGLRVERIVSTGQVTLEGQWYDQDAHEWVMVVEGAARLRIEGESEERELGEGDWILLPAHCRHRVTWTRASPPTIWLAVHFTPKGTE